MSDSIVLTRTATSADIIDALTGADEIIGRQNKRIAELEHALRSVMVGGNHLGLIIGADHPSHNADHESARNHYSGRQEMYVAWCCWRAIMQARDVLGEANGTNGGADV